MQFEINQVSQQLQHVQKDLINALENIETAAHFHLDPWVREEGGGGVTAVVEGGAVLDKAGVNFSHVNGDSLPASASAHRNLAPNSGFEALGLSVVIHPKNPYAPTSHMNTRLFVSNSAKGEPVWWFGGGFDLTPFYGFIEDCVLWHEAAQSACQPFGADVYPKFKKWCDEYFYLKHRQEPRGIGGIFYDDLNEWGFERCFAFHQAVSTAYQRAYLAILQKRIHTPYGEREKNHQLIRRGRYVEFNLVWDRGTLFGLQSHGRTESILMSLPPEVKWAYCAEPETEKEAELTNFYLKSCDWIQPSK